MKAFERDDGRVLEVVEGFREQMLSYRRAVTPRADWTGHDYVEAAEKKRRRFGRLLARFSEWGGQVEGARVLDVGCGDATNCLLLGFEPVRESTGPDEAGHRTRLLAWKLLPGEPIRRASRRIATANLLPDVTLPPAQLTPTIERDRRVPSEGGNSVNAIREALAGLPVRLIQMNATRLAFPDASFNWLLSRSAMEHIQPVKLALAEMARVVHPGGLVYLSIDPFYWVRGCHKRGLVDIPFAHARLTPEEFRRFVSEHEGESTAVKRCQRMETQNRLTRPQWRELIEAQSWDILDWAEERSRIGEQVLEQNPDILETLLPGVDRSDLLHERIRVWLRKRN